MKVRFILLFCCSLLVFKSAVHAQAPMPFGTMEYIDINNIKALQLVHGDMWWNPSLGVADCEFPKGSGKNISFASALWMSGYDAGNQLHIAAQTYRQKGNDYWPGPLDSSGNITYTTSQAWAKIWKLNRTQIDSFLASATHTTTNTPAPILQWPAKGNPYATGNGGVSLTINTDMAPFVDVNHDGIYNPLQGDYPAIKGDQTLWWLFNDNGPTHNETNGVPLKAEVQVMAYAYSRGTSIDNVIYYEYNIFNRSPDTYSNFRIGQFADMDLGYGLDDFVGFDSTHRMGITYNGNLIDGAGQANAYGNMIPTAAISMLTLPGDGANSLVPAGSFLAYSNDNGPQGNAATPGQYNNYLRSMWRDSTHLKNDFTPGTPSYGYGTGPGCNYEYTGDPADSSGWSECMSGNAPNDRRFIITSNDFTLSSGGSQKVTMALLTTNPSLNNGCHNTDFNAIKNMADSVWYIYQHPYPAAGITNVQQTIDLHIYPNPAHDKIFIDNGMPGANIIVYNMLGQIVYLPISSSQKTIELDITTLPSGIYNVRYGKNGIQGMARFVKD